MKKVIIALFIVMVLILVNKEEGNKVIIPNDAIRFRVIASSNNFKDQSTKAEVVSSLEPIITNILDNSNSKEETKTLINNNISLIQKEVSNKTKDFNINYGFNYFPQKEYRGVSYKSGMYESLVITLGSGLGDNWWCVLFPPLCLLEAKEEEYDDYTYSLYLKEKIDKYF